MNCGGSTGQVGVNADQMGRDAGRVAGRMGRDAGLGVRGRGPRGRGPSRRNQVALVRRIQGNIEALVCAEMQLDEARGGGFVAWVGRDAGLGVRIVRTANLACHTWRAAGPTQRMGRDAGLGVRGCGPRGRGPSHRNQVAQAKRIQENFEELGV